VPDKYKSLYRDVDNNPIHKCIRYTDMALREFFRTAEKQPWYKNTIFVLTSDHTNLSDHKEYQTDLGVYSAPIIIHDPSGEIAPGRSRHIAQQIDIMPTLLSFMGYPRPYVAFGKDLIKGSAADSWAVSFNNGIYQYVKGDYFLQFDGQSLRAVYNFRHDPLLKRNLIDSGPTAEMETIEKELKALIQSYMERMHDNQLIIK
jgi:phosphoglycerol transferase MdoB-like AlkP superfamily enzyme